MNLKLGLSTLLVATNLMGNPQDANQIEHLTETTKDKVEFIKKINSFNSELVSFNKHLEECYSYRGKIDGTNLWELHFANKETITEEGKTFKNPRLGKICDPKNGCTKYDIKNFNSIKSDENKTILEGNNLKVIYTIIPRKEEIHGSKCKLKSEEKK